MCGGLPKWSILIEQVDDLCSLCSLPPPSRGYCSMLFWASFDDPVIIANNEILHSWKVFHFVLEVTVGAFELDLHDKIGTGDLLPDLT